MCYANLDSSLWVEENKDKTVSNLHNTWQFDRKRQNEDKRALCRSAEG